MKEVQRETEFDRDLHQNLARTPDRRAGHGWKRVYKELYAAGKTCDNGGVGQLKRAWWT